MAKETIEKVRVLADFGFAGDEPVQVGEHPVVPRDFMITMLADYVHSVTDLLAPPATQPPDWSKEIVTEIHGKKDGAEMTYRLGTLTCKGALPTGVAPAIAGIWLAEGRVEPGVYPPEIALEPEPFFEELERKDILTRVSVTHKV
jgi:saccharopine dehydrogenase-like NADP-dependent oxidoreductase